MRARKLLAKFRPVKGVSCNSGSVKKGFVFVAVKGIKEDGNKFIDEAVGKGAKVVVSQKQKTKTQKLGRVAYVNVENARQFTGELAAEFYGNPSRKIKVVGITGTNGKTTITYLLEAVLKRSGFSSGVVGTINYRFNNNVIASKNTTPGPVELQSVLDRMRRARVDYCAMEVSSHALDQDRVAGIKFHSAIFTNLTQDHLDYHRTMERYFLAKAKLFSGLSPEVFAVLNNDDKFSRRLKKCTRARVITYAVDSPADLQAGDIVFKSDSTEFSFTYRGRKTRLKTNFIGKHNVYNVLAVLAWSLKAGLNISRVRDAVAGFKYVPGRLEGVETGRGFSVFVDYAHTEDALNNILRSLREVSQERIIVVFGCGGDRDKTKRPKMGRVATELADFAVITSDNPRSEEPLDIIRDIEAGIIKDNYCIVPERATAIKKALSLAKNGDIVLIAGKGHENYQVFKNKTVHFDDREAVSACLR